MTFNQLIRFDTLAGMAFLGLPAASSSLTGVLPYMAPAWLAWIFSGLLLNSLVHWKSYLPKLITDVMEYGKLRNRTQTTGGWRWDSLPKRLQGWIPQLNLELCSGPTHIVCLQWVGGACAVKMQLGSKVHADMLLCTPLHPSNKKGCKQV